MEKTAAPPPGEKTSSTTRGSLTCQAVLRAPLKSLGQGADRIVYTTGQPAWQCAFSRDGTWLAVCYGAPEPCVRIWKRSAQDEWQLHSTLSGIHERTIRSLDFAPTSTALSPLTLATASFDSTVAIWEYNAENDDGGGSAADGGDRSHSWECMAQLEGHDNEVKCVRWNATGSLLATCGRDKTVWIWECFLPGTVGGPSDAGGGGDYECIAVLHGHEADVKCIQFAPSHGQWGDGDEIVLSASYDDSIKCWAEDGGDWYCAASISDVHTSTIWSLALAPSGVRMVSASADASLAIYKCYTAREKKTMFPEENQNNNGVWKCVGKLDSAHSSTIYWVDYAPTKAGHGRIASCGADHRIQIYREAMGSSSDQPLFMLDESIRTDHGDVNHVCWHPLDGSLLASAGDDGSVRIWRYKP